MPIVMQFPGCPGNSTIKGYENWITLTSFETKTIRFVNNPYGTETDRESGSPTVDMVTLTKINDVATGKLWMQALTKAGDAATVKLAFLRTTDSSGAPPISYLDIELSNVLIANYHHAGGAGDARLEETLTLSYTKIKFNTSEMKKTGSAGTPDRLTYDLTTLSFS